jgi:hypothetical protein
VNKHEENLAFLYGAGVILTLIGIGLICYVVLEYARKISEQRRKRPRYVFDDKGRVIGRKEPLPPHHYCNWYMCLDPSAKQLCPHGDKQ